ncbi:MAG: pyridoxal phosphate-dependent aminotransferase [Candidatus Cloacimonadota bacterium]|nr:pyridoxal phosphate-dependent aminotransferase [Candidatus Cloacimonadota bacterium]
MDLSKRAVEVQASPIRKLMPYAETAKGKGIKIYHLNIGQPDIETPQVMIDVYRNYTDKVLAYGPSQGLLEYRKNLVNYYSRCDIDISTDEIIVTTAGSEAIIFAMMAICDPGDEIIIPEPFYTNYNGFATMVGAKIVPLTTYAEKGFALPPNEKIEQMISMKTKAIMLCNPGNPTGAVYSKHDLDRIAQLAIKHDIFVITDEVYREFVYDEEKHTSILTLDYISDRTIMVDSVSKRYSACGARIGCLISKNKDIIASVLKFAQARLCPPTLEQKAASAAAKLQEEYFEPTMNEYKKRRDIVFDKLQTMKGVICHKPHGAFYVIAKLTAIDDAEDFAKWMLAEFSYNNETVMFAPAEGFYATKGMGKNEIRIAYILNETDLEKAMDILTIGLEKYVALKGSKLDK